MESSFASVLRETTFTGVTGVAKGLLHYVPPSPVGLIFFLHRTNGNSGMIAKTEARYIASAAIARGCAVVSADAEEAAQMTPTAWFLATNDSNGAVDNDDARANSRLLADHQLHSDLAARTDSFFDSHLPQGYRR